MDLNLSVEYLATVVGLAFVLELILELFLKPALAGSEGAPWYGLAFNTSTFVLALGFSLLYEFLKGGLSGMVGLQAFLTALGATAVAVLGYEFVKNLSTARNGT